MQPSEAERKTPEEISWYLERYAKQLKDEEKEIKKAAGRGRRPKGRR